MFGNLLRSGACALGLATAALLSGCAANGTAVAPSSADTITIGQGGSYSIPVLSPSENTEAYAAAGSTKTRNLGQLAGVHQNYGQSQLVIPSATEVVGQVETPALAAAKIRAGQAH